MDVDLGDVVSSLERTPALLRAVFRRLPEPWERCHEGAGTFSPLDVLGHLIHGEETDWVPRVVLIREQGEARPFTPFDRLAFRAKYADWPSEALVERFALLREGNIERIRDLTPVDLERTGLHPEFGRVTLAQLLAAWVVHDLSHLSQILRVQAKQFDSAVGPWKAYLRILQH